MNLTGALKTWILLLPMCSAAAAHSLTLAPKGILRTKAGKPDLAAPAPRKPDDKPNLSKILQADPRDAKISLTVYVQANIGDSGLFPILLRAQSVASGMLATAGARINWRTGLAKPSEPELPILIDITSNTPEKFHPGTLAYAQVFEGGHVKVFYDRVRNAYRPQATAMLLAHVLVHEITHVLEGMDRHSQEGVMKARWTPDDLLRMVYQPLPFDPLDVRLIREGLLNRTRESARPARVANAETAAVSPGSRRTGRRCRPTHRSPE
jgi:hypothetical protein